MLQYFITFSPINFGEINLLKNILLFKFSIFSEYPEKVNTNRGRMVIILITIEINVLFNRCFDFKLQLMHSCIFLSHKIIEVVIRITELKNGVKLKHLIFLHKGEVDNKFFLMCIPIFENYL